jgi:hypothetical protein
VVKSEAIERTTARTMAGVVVVHSGTEPEQHDSHDSVTRSALARELAALKGFAFAGEYDAAFDYRAPVYHVPKDTVIGLRTARALGIRDENDLFGAVAPYPFVATKTICHPLVDRGARAPAGWSHAFTGAVVDQVLAGHAAFSIADALTAGERLLARGRVRVKRALGIGGRGQTVVSNVEALAETLAGIDAEELRTYGVSLEEDLADVVTYSVGWVAVAGMTASYHGRQRQTRNNAGHEVYGGSDLVVARGDCDALLELPVSEGTQRAVALARRFHKAAVEHYPDVILSRCNYDVAEGCDASGARREGVLEHSWRIGGASGAEIGALTAFRRDPSLRAVRASSVEVYGEFGPVPRGATVHFRGVDRKVGPLTKYSTVEPHVDAR